MKKGGNFVGLGMELFLRFSLTENTCSVANIEERGIKLR